ncbi:hypothetical protein E1B28_013258 [Marasmius oreades]|uniref:Uncharacterized protein n=1 Tax=Marasmius oreades TaxID=181124 RepID=A0A9P7RQ72_9AGAR|nr:uncharacterized protein E1B28_013258 [Marasmius oreades]KAG7087280.1 hypothetical protein E1B28_013258 [Marasmius oreades]
MASTTRYEPLDIDENVEHPSRRFSNTLLRNPRLQRYVLLALIFFVALSVFGIWRRPDVTGSGDTHGVADIGKIFWVNCEPLLQGVDCGFIVAPKDYSNHKIGTVSIYIARYKARRVPKKGAVFMNPGGPGHPGTPMALKKRLAMASIIGDDWDLVGFDPRGGGQTTPATRCFKSTEAFRRFFANTVVERGVTISSVSNLAAPTLRSLLVDQYNEFVRLKKEQGDICRMNMGDELRYMGSAMVARDIEFMSRVLEGNEAKINYWGESYGTVIGSNLINLFPERIGKVVIDGVVNPVVLSEEPTYKWPSDWLSDSEKTYELFLKDCSNAGPSRCPLAKFQGEPHQDIEARIEDFFDSIAQNPINISLGGRLGAGRGFLTSGTARALLLVALHSPNNWPHFSQTLASVMASNTTAQAALYDMAFPRLQEPPHPPFARDLERQAITCLDAPVSSFVSAGELADQTIKTLRETSKHFGASTGLSEPDGGCEFWPSNSEVERVEMRLDEANKKMKMEDGDRKILIISNTADPITPLSSGLLVNSLLADSSTLVIQDGPGHCSTSFLSRCMKDLQKAFWAGEVPTNGTVCRVDRKTFPD